MEKAILLAIAASFCTATAPVCQHLGARRYEMAGFDAGLVFRLARQPVWLLGMASMILGFVFQISALRFAFGYSGTPGTSPAGQSLRPLGVPVTTAPPAPPPVGRLTGSVSAG
jgi:hypothetical protein